MAISMAELAKQLLTAKQPERYSEVMDRGPYSTGEPLNIGYGAGDQMSPLDAAALITSPVPVVGDVTGLAADVDMYMRDPESRNIPNYILSAAGVVPFLPAVSQLRKGSESLGDAFKSNMASQTTQRANTVGTATKASSYLDSLGASGRSLDYGAGKGLNAEANAIDDTFEPFPNNDFNPTFMSPNEVPKNAYGKVISTNVINVLPPNLRQEAVFNIGNALEVGGKALIQTWDTNMAKKGMKSPKATAVKDEPLAYTTSTGSYQKGFTQAELKDYVGDVLGDSFEVLSVPSKQGISGVAVVVNRISPETPKGIKAYHGSPHSFDRFSTESIGTGEGAQQYGRGLYFAENEKVAREYKDQLSRDVEFESWLYDKYKEAERNEDYQRRDMYDSKLEDLKKYAADPDMKDADRKLAKEVIQEIEDYGPNLGRMYEVNLDVEPDELLDWYKPLSEQPNITVSEHLNSGEFSVSTGQEFGSQAFQDADDLSALSGGEYYKRLQASLVDSGWDNSLTAANSELKKSGIKGIRYADAFTRHKSPDKQSMNYVIFDDRLISIAKKYGVAIPVAAAMLARATGEDTSQSFQEET